MRHFREPLCGSQRTSLVQQSGSRLYRRNVRQRTDRDFDNTDSRLTLARIEIPGSRFPHGATQRALGSAVLSAAVALALMMPGTGFSQDSAATPDSSSSLPQEPIAAAPDPKAAEPKLSWDTGAGKNYLLPALEIFGFDFLLNRANQQIYEGNDYDVSSSTIKRNLRHSWGTDNDPFKVNQLGHPYQGSMYHGFARSAGLNYWESLGYTFAGSVMWEIAGETTRPSKNDQIASGIGGTFLGESLFRMSSLVLENAKGTPGFWRE